MNYASYTDATFKKFVRLNVCQNDRTLQKYLQEGKVREFRARLSKFKDADDRIQKVVMALVSDALKSTILSIVYQLHKKLEPFGYLIISGGVAINKYLPIEHKDIITDIDTKFVPSVKGISANSPKYFGYIQMAKLLMWNDLGALAERVSKSKQFKQKLENIRSSRVAKFLGISFKNPIITRRYSVIPKYKGARGTGVSPGDVLIDVEIMALDLKGIRYYHPSSRRITLDSIPGVLDIAYMRKGEIGGKVLASTTKGLGHHRNILVAGRDFLIEDMYLLKSLRLRPQKMRKDRERLEKFAKYVYKLKVKATNSNFNIYKKVANKSMDTKRLQNRRGVTDAMIKRISQIVPQKYTKYTTKPTRRRLLRITGHNRNKTSADYRFNVETRRWVKVSPKSTYIRNTGGSGLYGYNPKRDAWIPSDIIKKVSLLPYIGI